MTSTNTLRHRSKPATKKSVDQGSNGKGRQKPYHWSTRLIACLIGTHILTFSMGIFISRGGGGEQEIMNVEASVDSKTMSQTHTVTNIRLSPKNERKVYSQNGEDGIIEAIFMQIGVTDKYYVEFGTQDGSEINTRNLRENYGWNGLLMDGSHENETINLHKEWLLPSNIVSLFQKYDVPKQFDLLSTDTDFKDFWISEAILSGDYRPRVIISEVNSCFDPSLALTVPLNTGDQKGGDFTYYFGASPLALSILYNQYGYAMVYCETTGVNCFWIRKDYMTKEDRIRFGQMQSVIELQQCAAYADNEGCWFTPQTDENHASWKEIVNDWESAANFSAKPISVGFEELDRRRCRTAKQMRIIS